MSVYIASDNKGTELKKLIKERLSLKYNIIINNEEDYEDDDYPDYAFELCSKMSKEEDYGILINSNGIGMSIAANKVKGIRCARVLSIEDTKEAKEYNYVNVISIPSTMDIDLAEEIIIKLIETPKSDIDRHKRRVNKIKMYEKGEYNEV